MAPADPPLPLLAGEEGPKPSGLGGEGLYAGLSKTLTSHPLRGWAPPLP
ncbi:MAG: hypothetical protein QOJ27_949 [Sphingomonadales bacterium]|nr:hypothetical protein [Sphingomonadales bacterium]